MCDLSESKRMRDVHGMVVSARRNKLLQKMRLLRLVSIEKVLRTSVRKMCRCV